MPSVIDRTTTAPPFPLRLRDWPRSLVLACALCLGAVLAAEGGEPAPSDALLQFVPADAGLVLTIDGLRDQAGAILESRLLKEIQGLPAFQAWLASEKVQAFERSRAQIEEFLQTSFGEVRDEILGDAVVLVVRFPSEKADDPAEARGLLLLKARDAKLLRRLVDRINAAQLKDGEIAELTDQTRGETVYHKRTFHADENRAPESFVIFADGTFGFSNAESLIHEVIDRKMAKTESRGSIAVVDRPGFKTAAARLPSKAAARLFVDPEAAGRLFGAVPASATDDDRRARAILDRYINGLDYVAAALAVNDRELRLKAVQAFRASGFRELVGAWTSDRTDHRSGSRLLMVPASTIALASLNVDFPALYRALVDLVPDRRLTISKVETLAEGLLFGIDFRRRVLPAIGPRVVVAIDPPDFSAEANEAPSRGFPFPLVVAAELDEDAGLPTGGDGSPTVAAALDNALKTVLAAVALDEKRVPASTRLEVRDLDGVSVRSLSSPYPFAFAVDRPGRRLVLGVSAETVIRYLRAGADPRAGARFQAIRSAACPDSESYVCLDLAAVHDLARKHRDRLIDATARKQGRSASDVARDLDHVLGLVRLFDAAFLCARVDAENSVVEHAVGLLSKPGDLGR